MFNNDLFSDVKFVVPKANGESESKEVIPAHKFVLSISSPVFEAMFYGELAETRDSIELPDCEYESLLELFRYMYSDEVNLSGSNVMRVLYLAKKYMVPSLADKCTEYLKEYLDSSNVFSILPSAQKYDEKNLLDRCWKVIDKEAEEVVKSDEFATIERTLLEAVVKRETLSIKEVNLFQAVDLWATKECERQGLTADGEVKRRILGEQIVKGIRFPVIKEAEFVNAVIDSKILTSEEVISFFKYFNSALSSPLQFLELERSGFHDNDIHRCRRFESINKVCCRKRGSLGEELDCIDFVVDKDIKLHGVCLFGSKNTDYSVSLKIKNMHSDDNLQVLASSNGIFSSTLLPYGSHKNYYGFEVLLDSAADIKENTRFQIETYVTGSHFSREPKGGLSIVHCSGVTFTFVNSMRHGNGTNTTMGQFPEISFSVVTKSG